MLKLTFLGTSAGVPSRQRNVSGLALEPTNRHAGWFLIDCGEGTQQRLQRTKLSLHTLTAICITHVHGDHCFGLPGLIASIGMAGRKEKLILIAPQPIWDWLQMTLDLTQSHIPYPIQHIDVALMTTSPESLQSSGIQLSRHELLHRTPSYGYGFTLTTKKRRLNVPALKAIGLPAGPMWKALQQGNTVTFNDKSLQCDDFVTTNTESVNVLIGGDNADPNLLRAACQNTQLLVHEATYTQNILDIVGTGPMHSSAQLVAQFAEAVAVPNLILTHLSARYHNREGMQAILSEAQAHYQGSVYVANDLDCFQLSAAGELTLLPPII